MNEKRYLILFLGILTALIFIERPKTYLFEPDEARYSEIPREMLASGDFVSPRQNGSLYMEKPPLLYWANAASIKILGETPYAARLPSRLASLGVLLLLAFLLTSTESPLLGLWSALIYAGSLIAFALSRVNITDGLLTFTMTLAFLSVWKWIEAIKEGQSTWAWEIGIGLGCALSVLTKGLIGLVFPGTVFLLWVLFTKNWRFISKIIFSWAFPVFLLVGLPWFVLVQKANPQFFDFFVINEHFRRFTTTIHKRQEPFYFFILIFLAGFVPWTIPFLIRVWALLKRWKETVQSADLFFLLWFLFIIVFFSLSHSKLIPYILPAIPAAAILLARALVVDDQTLKKGLTPTAILLTLIILAMLFLIDGEKLTDQYLFAAVGFLPMIFSPVFVWLGVRRQATIKKAFMFLSLTWVGLGASALILLPSISKTYSAEPLVLNAIRMNPDEFASYHCYPETIPWTLKKPVPVVQFVGELASIGPKDPALFWTDDKFWEEWSSEKRVAVIFRHQEEAHFKSLSKKPVYIWERNKRHLIATNFSPNDQKL